MAYRAASQKFTDTVMSWNKAICQNDEMFASKINQIPEMFTDIKSWSDSFRYHILEEMRASIKSDLDSIDIGILRKTIFALGTDDNEQECLVIRKKNLELDKPTPVLLVRGQGVSEESKFAMMELISSDRSNFYVLLTSPYSNEILHQIETRGAEENEDNWSLYLLTATMIPSMRICDGLYSSSRLPQSSLLDELLSCRCTYSTSVILNKALPPDTAKLLKELNESQVTAVRSVINTILSAKSNGSHLQVILGPPGTGKTNTLATLIVTILYQSYFPNTSNRLHVSAPTNQAIAELTKRTLKNIQKQATSAMDIRCKSRHILLIGNKESLNITCDLEEIFLDARLRRVSEGLAGWVATIGDLKKQLSPTIKKTSPSSGILTTCIECGTAIHNDLPDPYINDINRKYMKKIVGILKNYRTLCNKKNTASALDSQRSQIEYELKSETSKEIFQICVKFLKLKRKEREDAIINDARVVFSTVSAGGGAILEKQHFDVAIIDEATQLVEASTSIMLYEDLKCLVLAGDNKQLPSTVISKLAEQRGYGRSLFDRLLHHNFPSLLLNIQYRMHPAISFWPNHEFYDGKITDGENVLSKAFTKYWHHTLPPFSIRDIVGDERKSVTGSLFNEAEANAIVEVINDLFKLITAAFKLQNNQGPVIVGILSPYKAQCELIEKRSRSVTIKSRRVMTIICRTIDGFQGQECDIIILSTVRSNDRGSLGFVSDCRRLNVAITRPRYSLLLVGNCSTLKRDERWERLLQPRKYVEPMKVISGTAPSKQNSVIEALKTSKKKQKAKANLNSNEVKTGNLSSIASSKQNAVVATMSTCNKHTKGNIVESNKKQKAEILKLKNAMKLMQLKLSKRQMGG